MNRSAVKREFNDDDDQSDYSPPPVNRRGAPRKRASPRDSGDEPVMSRPPLPMPHNGRPPEAAEDGDEPVTHVFHPMWKALFVDAGKTPVSRSECFGCNYGQLNIESHPYEGYTALTRDLYKHVVAHGLYAGMKWAGAFYRTQVQNKLRIDHTRPGPRPSTDFDEVSIVWHMFKHANIAQYEWLGEMLELKFVAAHLMEHQMFVVPQFGDPVHDITVDPTTPRVLAPIMSMLDRKRKMDLRKMPNFHTGIGLSTENATSIAFDTDRFTASGPLHQ